MEDGLLQIINSGGLKFHIRQGTSDAVVVEDNTTNHSYEKFFPICTGERWIDVGGYIGAFAARVRQMGGDVFSFEPDLSHYELYKLNQQLNGFPANIRHSAASQKSPKNGKIRLYLNDYKGNYAGNSVFMRWKKARPYVDVPCIGFDDCVTIAKDNLKGDGPLCLKLDAEGVEIEILENFKQPDIFKIVLEYHFGVDPSLDRLRNICTRLEKQGYLVLPEHKIPEGSVWKQFRKITTLLYAIKNPKAEDLHAKHRKRLSST